MLECRERLNFNKLTKIHFTHWKLLDNQSHGIIRCFQKPNKVCG